VSKDVVKFVIENIGGIHGRWEFELKPGLNLLPASNALGRGSFVCGFQALVAENKELRPSF
jgi:hypothetical protein